MALDMYSSEVPGGTRIRIEMNGLVDPLAARRGTNPRLPFRTAPLVAANDPLPAETVAAAALLCHRAGDWLMRASALAGALQRPEALARTEAHLATMRAELAQMIRVFEQVDESLATLRGLAERDARIAAMQAGEGGVS